MATYTPLLLIVSVLSLLSSVESDSSSSSNGDFDSDDGVNSNNFVSRIGVANRGSKNGLLIESENESSVLSIGLNSTSSEPMYISASPLTNEFYIGDRGNNAFYVYDTITLKRIDIIPGCNGIFHQTYNFLNQLWIVCDIDKTILVIDTETRKKIITIEINDIFDDLSGYKPHDITTNKEYAFVSLLKPGDINGYIIQYSTETFSELNRISIGGDPHLFLDSFDSNPNYLYVASQSVGLVYKIDIDTLKIVDTLNVNGAHGIFGTQDYLYVTDITSSNGDNSLYVIDLYLFEQDTVRIFDAKSGGPHNLMINSESNKLFVTHSSSGIVSVYDITNDGGLDSENGRIIFDDNGSIPFGIMCIIGLDEYNLIKADKGK